MLGAPERHRTYPIAPEGDGGVADDTGFPERDQTDENQKASPIRSKRSKRHNYIGKGEPLQTAGTHSLAVIIPRTLHQRATETVESNYLGTPNYLYSTCITYCYYFSLLRNVTIFYYAVILLIEPIFYYRLWGLIMA